MARRRPTVTLRAALWTASVICFSAGLSMSAFDASAQSNQLLGNPNVLIIITDDQPVGTMSVMPDTRNYFVEQGTKFKNAFPTNPMCCPARATLMTGRYSHNNGVRSNEDVQNLDMNSTIQRYLQDAGYHTALYGKFLNRWHEDPPHFDRWGVITGPYKYFDTVWNVDGEQELVEGYWTDALAEKSVEFLSGLETARDDEPWLLYISSPAPHSPHKVAPEYQGETVPDWKADPSVPERNKSDKPRYVRQRSATQREAARIARRQMRMLLSVDDLVADVMEKLDELAEQNTIAFFLSDNGYLWGQHGLLGGAEAKGNPYARSVKVPMMMRWPGQVLPGIVDKRLIGFIDVAPTILDAVGIEPDAEYPQDGRSLFDDWTRSRIVNESWRPSDAAPSQPPDWVALRTARYNYVEYRSLGRIIFREYYDLRDDPYELRNLLHDKDPTNDPNVRRLHRMLAGDRRCGGDSCP